MQTEERETERAEVAGEGEVDGMPSESRTESRGYFITALPYYTYPSWFPLPEGVADNSLLPGKHNKREPLTLTQCAGRPPCWCGLLIHVQSAPRPILHHPEIPQRQASHTA